MLIVDKSEVKLPGEAKQNNLPPECGRPIDGASKTKAWKTLSRRDKPESLQMWDVINPIIYKMEDTKKHMQYLIPSTVVLQIQLWKK
jgi:hypothetical protein